MTFQSPYAEPLCYTNAELRQMVASQVCGEGVVSDGLEVTTGGANLDLFVAAGEAYIAGTQDAPDQGMYWVRNNAQETVTADAADATDPRIDQVIVTVRDGDYGGLDYDVVADVLAGTPTAGATLTNLNGAATLPDNTIRLAYILVPATFTGPFVNATHIKNARVPFTLCGSGYRDYTPTIAGVAATINYARYSRIGDRISGYVQVTFTGAPTTFVSVTLPVAAAQSTYTALTVGAGNIYDTSTGFSYNTNPTLYTGSATQLSFPWVSDTTPATYIRDGQGWASGDVIGFTFDYEAA